jgi:hypothetical protein
MFQAEDKLTSLSVLSAPVSTLREHSLEAKLFLNSEKTPNEGGNSNFQAIEIQVFEVVRDFGNSGQWPVADGQ